MELPDPSPPAPPGAASPVAEPAGASRGRAPPPTLRVAVVMSREREPNAWEPWRHAVDEVIVDPDGAFGPSARPLRDDGRVATTLHPGLEVALHRDEGEGHHLNLTSGRPVWFVMWRVDDEAPERAWPQAVTVSYHEAARWLDAQERVDPLPLPPDVTAWLQAFNDANWTPQPKERRRPASFRSPSERG